jgi:vacuolar iron transporter family protein
MKGLYKNIQTEIDTAFLYDKLAANEEDIDVAKIFAQMSCIEKDHAVAFMAKLQVPNKTMPPPSFRAKILNWIGSKFGYDLVLGVVLNIEKSIAAADINKRQRQNIALKGNEVNHVKILRSLIEANTNVSGSTITRFEKRHRSVGGNALRAGVLGGNDGLVSNFSLVMGIAGATQGGQGVLLAGLAGLLAGALSMALGEWISVKSSQELYENQMQLEMEEIETSPESEEKELALIYLAKGIPSIQAHEMAKDIMKDKTKAHSILIKEELGIDADELKGSAMEAALYSFFLFAIGAVIPVVPFIFFTGTHAVMLSILFSAIGLFLIGSAITLFTGKSIWYSGIRQVLFGLAAAAITFGIGKLIGVSITG